ncbi:MAG TPA: hypothetical protein VMK84_15740 [Streptosporangiaceae bacterium]|nr:hypothetical protein [Streptosporangiaceae bacterium]
MGRLKSAIYARMEEVSFRSGAALAGGVIIAAGVAITLAVVPGGPGDVVAGAPASRAAASSVSPPAPVSASAWPPPAPRPSRTTVPVTVAGDYRPPSPVRAPATRPAVTTPVPAAIATPRPFTRRWPSGWRGRHRPHAPWPWGLLPHHHRR